MKRPLPGFLILLLGFIALSGCGSCITGGAMAKGTATAAVDDFHTRYNRKDYPGICAMVSDDFHKSTTDEQFTKVLTLVQQKLGTVKNSNETNWKVFVGTGGTQVTLSYDTEFSNAKGTEEFVWVVEGGRARLFNYRVNSPALLEK